MTTGGYDQCFRSAAFTARTLFAWLLGAVGGALRAASSLMPASASAVKSTEAKPGAQIVEREFGMFEVHSRTQAEVLEAGRIVLDRLGLNIAERIKRICFDGVTRL